MSNREKIEIYPADNGFIVKIREGMDGMQVFNGVQDLVGFISAYYDPAKAAVDLSQKIAEKQKELGDAA